MRRRPMRYFRLSGDVVEAWSARRQEPFAARQPRRFNIKDARQRFIVERRCGGAVCDDCAAVEHGNPVGIARNQRKFMQRDDDRRAT